MIEATKTTPEFRWAPIAGAHGKGLSCYFGGKGRQAMLIPARAGVMRGGQRIYTADEPVIGYELTVDAIVQSVLIDCSLDRARVFAENILASRFRYDFTLLPTPAPVPMSPGG